MPQRPTFPSPYLNSIDATKDNDFICLINERDIIKGYSFTIYSLDGKTKAYEISVDDLGDKIIYGGRGNDSYLIVNVPSNNPKNDLRSELENGKEYKWSVKLTDNLGNKVTSKEYYFKCVESATLSIRSEDIIEDTLNIASTTFLGTYTCSSPMVYYKFILYKDNELIVDTGEVYSPYISFEYDMFVNGSYSLELIVENETKARSETRMDFIVDYAVAPTNIAPKCSVSPNENSVLIDFSEQMTIPPIYESSSEGFKEINISDTLKGLYIPKNAKLSWQERVGVSDGLNIDEDNFSIQIMANLPYGKQGEILRLSGDSEIIVFYDRFELIYGYSKGLSGRIKIHEGDEEYTSGNISSLDTIDNNKIYAYTFNNNDKYNFTEDYQFVFQNPMNVFWWLITITQDGVTATKGVDVNV